MTDPFKIFEEWYTQAQELESHNPNAMCLATADSSGVPSARIVLLKDVSEEGFVFYTNQDSQKGKELTENPHAALCFYWKSSNKQVRIEGAIEIVKDSLSDEYFSSRPRSSQIGAWASQQSRPMTHKDTLSEEVLRHEEKFKDQDPIPRPEYWKGFLLVPNRIEFWTEKPYRLHERHVFSRIEKGWDSEWLFP